MSKALVAVILTVGVLALLILAVPTLIDATEDDNRGTVTVHEGDPTVVNGVLRVSVQDVDQGTGTANVSVTDVDTGSSVSRSMSVGATETVTLEGETLQITLVATDDADTASVTLVYPPTYGWSSLAVAVHDRLDVVLTLVALLVVFGVLIRVIR